MGSLLGRFIRAAAVAAGSEQFRWKLFPGARRRCRSCGKEPLRIQDVGEHRRLFPGGTDFLCVECQRTTVAERVQETRRALGLPPRQENP